MCFTSNAPHPPALVANNLGLGVPPRALVARISDTNTPSIRLFECLGFRITRRVAVFAEVEMRWGAPMQA